MIYIRHRIEDMVVQFIQVILWSPVQNALLAMQMCLKKINHHRSSAQRHLAPFITVLYYILVIWVYLMIGFIYSLYYINQINIIYYRYILYSSGLVACLLPSRWWPGTTCSLRSEHRTYCHIWIYIKCAFGYVQNIYVRVSIDLRFHLFTIEVSSTHLPTHRPPPSPITFSTVSTEMLSISKTSMTASWEWATKSTSQWQWRW